MTHHDTRTHHNSTTAAHAPAARLRERFADPLATLRAATQPRSVRTVGRASRSRVASGTVLLAFAALFALALGMRLEDPLSDPLIGAEDPFTHIVIAKETVRRGYIDGSDVLNYPLYPPGLHALIAIYWPMSGLELYDVARFLPPIIGALGVLALAALLHEEAGLAAGLAGGLIAATLPEHIFRTNLLFPTALDLVLIPTLLLLAARLTRGDGWAAMPLVVVGGALTLSHPWAIMLTAPVIAGFVVLRVALPPGGTRLAPAGAAAALALGAGLGWAGYKWWQDAEFISTGDFGEHLPNALPLTAGMLGIGTGTLVGLLAAGAAALGVAAVATRWLPAQGRARAAAATAVGLTLLVASVLVTGTLGAYPPPHVHYETMLGAPAIWLAYFGLVAVALRRSAAGDLGLVLAAVTFPVTAIDFFNSALYWPHRTVAYMSIGVALLGGVAVGAAAESVARVASRLGVPRARASVAAAALAACVLAVHVVPVGQATYQWERYYDDEQFVVVDAARDVLAEDPDAVVIVGSWQPNLFLRAISDERRVVWAPQALEDAAARDDVLGWLHSEGKHAYVLVDHYTFGEFEMWDRAGDPMPGVPLTRVAVCCGERGGLYRVDG